MLAILYFQENFSNPVFPGQWEWSIMFSWNILNNIIKWKDGQGVNEGGNEGGGGGWISVLSRTGVKRENIKFLN